MRIIAWILAFYPRLWRERYQEEMLALLEQHTITFRTGFDLLLGALDARLDPAYRTKEGFMLQRLHDIRSLSLVYIGALAVFLFSINFWHLTADALVPEESIHGIIIWIGTCSWLVILLALLSGITGSILKNACKNRQIGTLLFALICLTPTIVLTIRPFQNVSPQYYTLKGLFLVINPWLIIGSSLFITGVKGMKLLMARQGGFLLFILLFVFLLSAVQILCNGDAHAIAIDQSMTGIFATILHNLLSYMPIGALFLTLADVPFYERSMYTTQLFGTLIALNLALDLTMAIIIDMIWISSGVWKVNAQIGVLSFFSAEGVGLLITSACILAFTYAIVLITLIRSFTISPRGEDVTERVTT